MYLLIWNLFIQADIIWSGIMLILYVSPVWVIHPCKHWICKTFNKLNTWIITSPSPTVVFATWVHSLPLWTVVQFTFNYFRKETAFEKFLQSLTFLDKVIFKFWEKRLGWWYLNLLVSKAFFFSSISKITKSPMLYLKTYLYISQKLLP